MNRHNVPSVSAVMVLGLALVPSGAIAQQKSLKEQLVGTWTVVSCDSTSANGAKQPFCQNPNGILMLDAGGRYATVTAARGRPKLPSGNRSDVPAEQFKSAVMGLAANFGTWTVNEADKTMTLHYDGALFPNIEGSDVKQTVSLNGDELRIIQPMPVLGGRGEMVYRRAK